MSTVAITPGFTRARTLAAPPAVRLTRRGRLAVVVVFLGLLLAVLTVLGPRSAATSEVGNPVQTRTVVIGSGDSLWRIAAEVAPAGQVRETVHRIEELNALSGPAVTVGQEIAVPVG